MSDVYGLTKCCVLAAVMVVAACASSVDTTPKIANVNEPGDETLSCGELKSKIADLDSTLRNLQSDLASAESNMSQVQFQQRYGSTPSPTSTGSSADAWIAMLSAFGDMLNDSMSTNYQKQISEDQSSIGVGTQRRQYLVGIYNNRCNA